MTATTHHLAQFNVARLRAPLDSEQLAGFVARIEEINALADQAPGFVWRLQDESGDATSYRPFDDDLIAVNMSVWTSMEALWEFVYRSAHLDVMRRRREWMHRMAEPFQVLWWVPAGHLPTLAEAVERLERLRADGPGPGAFTFREPHPAPGGSLANQSGGAPSAAEVPAVGVG